MSDVIKTHFEPGMLGVNHWVCARCGHVMASSTMSGTIPKRNGEKMTSGAGPVIQWRWDTNSLNHIPQCARCEATGIGKELTLDGEVLQLSSPTLFHRDARQIWATVPEYTTKSGKLSTRRKVWEDEKPVALRNKIADKERQNIDWINTDMGDEALEALTSLIMLYPGLQCRVVVLSLLERSEKLHPIRFGTTWHGEPSRKWMKGRNDWANSGSWINAMDGKYVMMDAELDQITTKYAFWCKAKEEAKTSGRRKKCIWVIAQLIKEFEKKNAWLMALKSTNISMDRGNEVIDPAQVDGHDVTTRYVRWYNPTTKRMEKTGEYGDHRTVRYIDQMDADEGDDSFSHQSMLDDDDVIVSTEDIHYEWIDLNKSVKGYNRILMEELKIGFDDTDTNPSSWVPNEVPDSKDNDTSI